MTITRITGAMPLVFGSLLLSTGCFSPKISEGVICGEDESCPAGMQCDPADGRCRTDLLQLSDNLRILPATFDFGPVVEGNASSPSSFSVLNLGLGDSEPLQIELQDSAQFTITSNDCEGTVLPREGSCTVTGRFEPTGPGEASSTLTVKDTASIGRADFTGTGLALGDLQVTPSGHQYDVVAVDGFSDPVTFTVVNSGETPTSELSFSLGVNSAFSVLNDECSTLALPGGGSCTIDVEFRPKIGGSSVSSLVVQATVGGAGVASLGGTGSAELKLTNDGPVVGTVVSSPGGLNCGVDCTTSFDVKTVTLTALSAGTAKFLRWEGVPVCDEGLNICAVTMDQASVDVHAVWDSCTPDQFLRCQNASIIVFCGQDGQGERQMDCPNGCNPDYGRCNDCVPGESMCTGLSTVATCGADGTYGAEDACLGDCANGVCEGGVFTPPG